jgi:hypothetical protein
MPVHRSLLILTTDATALQRWWTIGGGPCKWETIMIFLYLDRCIFKELCRLPRVIVLTIADPANEVLKLITNVPRVEDGVNLPLFFAVYDVWWWLRELAPRDCIGAV